MSWLQRLTETYDACVGRTDLGEDLLALSARFLRKPRYISLFGRTALFSMLNCLSRRTPQCL